VAVRSQVRQRRCGAGEVVGSKLAVPAKQPEIMMKLVSIFGNYFYKNCPSKLSKRAQNLGTNVAQIFIKK
jgi:hypothetical protein